MNLNLHLLRMFFTVVNHGSFSGAAKDLRVSQPAVSKGVREFEAQTGLTLIRRAHGVQPTEAGRALMTHARTLFAAERAAIHELTAIRGLERGTLHVGASTTIATYFLPPILREFQRAHPSIELRLTSANTLTVAEMLMSGMVDVALVEGPVEGPGVLIKPWREDSLVLCAAPSQRSGSPEAPVCPARISEELIILRERGSGTRDMAVAALSRAEIIPKRVLEIGSNEAITQLVSAGIGVAVMSSAVAADQLALGRIKPVIVEGLPVQRTLSRLSMPNDRPSRAAALFNRLLDAHQGDFPH